MSRSYSDPSYGSKKTMVLPVTAVIDGTGTAVTLNSAIKIMQPVEVTDFNLHTVTAGTGVSHGDVVLGYSLAGTGTFSAFGTATTVGTQAIYSKVDGSVTATKLATDDQIQVKFDGTGVDVSTYVPRVQVTETFVVSDS